MTALRRSLAVLALAAVVWALVIGFAGGVNLSVGGLKVTSFDSVRPLVVALVAALGYAWLAGRTGARRDLALVLHHAPAPRLAALLAFATAALGLAGTEWAATGADAYAYVSHADLWMSGELKIPIPLADAAPWPNALETFAPFGYRPAPDATAIVPVTAPGVPMLMAAMKAVAGHCAVFWLGPLAAGVLVWTTFALGRRIASDAVGLGGAWLLATSPVVLMMAKSPMSDVPAATFWALSMAGLLAETRPGALGAGVSAAIGLLIRPNLAPVAAGMGIWCVWRQRRTVRPRQWQLPLLFAAGVIAAVLVVARINASLYGSPFTSGYGSVRSLFALTNVATNLRLFGSWLIQTQTPLAILGLLAVVVPVRAVWKTAEAQHGAALLGIVGIGVWAAYCLYTPFDAWWYLRFLLPAWPSMCVGTAAIVIRLAEAHGRWAHRAATAILLALGIFGVVTAVGRNAFPRDEGERRYVTIADLVARGTEPSAVILTGQQIGSLRYYSGRLTLQFGSLDAAWLDRAVAWLATQRRPAYILLEDWEVPLFQGRFGDASALGRLEIAPVIAYRGARTTSTTFLYDPRRPDGPTLRPPPVRDPRPRCGLPASAHWVTRDTVGQPATR